MRDAFLADSIVPQTFIKRRQPGQPHGFVQVLRFVGLHQTRSGARALIVRLAKVGLLMAML